MGFKVQSKQCETCIYKKDSPLDIVKLESAIKDSNLEGFFSRFRICHHSKEACCRGFWNRHKDDFALGQLSQRLKMVEFVQEDSLKKEIKDAS